MSIRRVLDVESDIGFLVLVSHCCKATVERELRVEQLKRPVFALSHKNRTIRCPMHNVHH